MLWNAANIKLIIKVYNHKFIECRMSIKRSKIIQHMKEMRRVINIKPGSCTDKYTSD